MSGSAFAVVAFSLRAGTWHVKPAAANLRLCTRRIQNQTVKFRIYAQDQTDKKCG